VGVVVSSAIKESAQDGLTTEVTVSDNRIRLNWDTVYCVFNMVEIIEDDPDQPFIQRKKRFWHILPENWHAQTKTYTNKPYTGEEVCEQLFAADSVKFAWSGSYNSKFSKPVFGIDCNTGKKLGNAIQEVCDKLGVLMSIEGANTLIFATKGEGVAPQPPPYNSDDRIRGTALGPETMVRIVGDRNVYQDLPIDLEPDWIRAYEKFWFQPAWIAEVRSKFNIADYGEATARSKEITLREYAEKAGGQYMDVGTWGDISRAELPVWAYLTDIVFKSYRVPRTFTVNNIPLSSLAMREGLLQRVKLIDDSSGMIAYDEDESASYPDAKGYCIVKGQPLSIINPETYDSITPEILATAAQKWQPINRFSLDVKNFAILFEEPVFYSNDLYVRGNPDVEDEKLRSIVVPNAGASIAPAGVRASLCFEAERYARWFGSGPRQGVQYVPGLNYHTLFNQHSWLSEVNYGGESEGGADQLADEAADAYLTGQNMIESGGFTRYGVAGMSLNGAIDRITVTMRFTNGGEGDGISEQVEYAKERNPTSFESERELERRAQNRDLFPGQSRLLEEARQDRALARLLKSSKNPIDHPIKTLDQIATCLLGNPQPSVSYVFLDSDFSYPVGMPVMVDDNNIVSSTGSRFAGCLTVDNSPAQANAPIPVAAQGMVPCRVKGPFSRNDSVGVNDADNFASRSGKTYIGEVQQSYSGTATVLVMVRLGGSRQGSHPFRLSAATSEGVLGLHVEYGGVIDHSDWRNPKFYPATIGEQSLVPDSEGNRPFLNLPAGNAAWIYAKVLQGTAGEVETSEVANVDIEAFAAQQTAVPSNKAYVLIGIVDLAGTGENRKVTAIRQITASHIMWPIKPDFMGWLQKDPADSSSKAAFWLGDQNPYRPGASQLNDFWVQVRRAEFDNGLGGDSPFFIGLTEGAGSSQQAIHRSALRGVWAILSDAATSWNVDAKNEAHSGVGITTSDATANLNVRGSGENAQIQASTTATLATITATANSGTVTITGDSVASIALAGENGGTATLDVGEQAMLTLDTNCELSFEGGLHFKGDGDPTIYEKGKITMGGTEFTPKIFRKNVDDDGTKILAENNILIRDLPPVIEWLPDILKLAIGVSPAATFALLEMVVSASTGTIRLNNVSQPTLELENGGGKASLTATDDSGALSINDGVVYADSEEGFKHSPEGDNEAKLTAENLLIGDQSGDGVKVDIADIGGKGLITVRELDVCHMGAPGMRRFLCTESYAPPAS